RAILAPLAATRHHARRAPRELRGTVRSALRRHTDSLRLGHRTTGPRFHGRSSVLLLVDAVRDAGALYPAHARGERSAARRPAGGAPARGRAATEDGAVARRFGLDRMTRS